MVSLAVVVYGSPPCARGRLVLDTGGVFLRRFTPVCTGKTIALARARAASTVHPRVHGEDPAK